MTWQLCNKSSEFLVDLWGGQPDDTSWQAAKKHFRDKGYFGDWLLISRSMNGNFRVYHVNIKKKENDR